MVFSYKLTKGNNIPNEIDNRSPDLIDNSQDQGRELCNQNQHRREFHFL